MCVCVCVYLYDCGVLFVCVKAYLKGETVSIDDYHAKIESSHFHHSFLLGSVGLPGRPGSTTHFLFCSITNNTHCWLCVCVCVCVCGKVKVWAWWLCWWRATLSGCVAKVVVDDYYIASWPTDPFLAVVVYYVRIYTLYLMHYRFWRTLSYADCILSLFRNFIIQSTFDPFHDAPHLWQSSCTTVTYIALPRVTCLLHELSSM